MHYYERCSKLLWGSCHCGGARRISSVDTADANGDVCLNGPAGWQSYVRVWLTGGTYVSSGVHYTFPSRNGR